MTPKVAAQLTVIHCFLVHASKREETQPAIGGTSVPKQGRLFDMLNDIFINTEKDYRVSPPDLSNIEKYLFGPFKRCLFYVQKFDSDPERRLAVILERDALKWIRPAKGQIEMEYRQGAEHLEYLPDFIAETDETKLMLETKARNAMSDADVIAKKDVAVTWCKNASAHAATYGGKPWRYALIPDTAIAENMTLKGLVQKYGS